MNKVNKSVFVYEFYECVHVVSEAARMRVDPVYAALRYGTSLAQMSRSSFGSLSESPTRSLVWCHHPVVGVGVGGGLKVKDSFLIIFIYYLSYFQSKFTSQIL